MIDQRQFIVAVGVHVRKPGGELHIVDLQVDADCGKLTTQLVAQLGAVGVGVGEGERERMVGGIARCGHQLLGFAHVVGIQAGQVLIAGVDGRDRPAERGIDTTARGDDFLVVDGVANGLAHALVRQLVVRAVEDECELVAALVHDCLEIRGVQRFCQRGVHRQEHLHVAAFQGVDARVVVRQEAKHHALGCGLVLAAPIVRVSFEHHLVGRIEGFDSVWPRAKGLGFRVVLRVFVEHQAGATRQIPQQIGVGAAQREPDGIRIHGFGALKACDLIGVVILLFFELVDGPGHILGVKVVAVGEAHVFVQVERIGLAVRGNIPAFGQAGLHLVVGAARDKPFIHIADQHLFEGGAGLLADVEADRREFEADGDGVARLAGLRAACAASRHTHAYDDGDGRNRRDNHPKPILGFAALRLFDARIQALVRAGGVLGCFGAIGTALLFGCVGFAVHTIILRHGISLQRPNAKRAAFMSS